MVAVANLEELFVTTAAASERVMVARNDARDGALVVIRAIEARLQEALRGDTLRGMSWLVDRQLHGARVYGKPGYGIDSYLPLDGRPFLCLSKDGVLVMAWAWSIPGRHTAAETRPVRDDELRAQDLGPIAECVRAVLGRHVARSAATAETYEAASALARALAGALEPGF